MMNQKSRRAIQLGFMGLQALLIILLITGTLGIVHKYCPYSVVCFGAEGCRATFPQFLYPIAMLVGLLIAVSTMFAGRLFCSHVCIFGTVQELIFLLRSKQYRMKKRMPYYLERKLSWVKYGVFLFTVVTAVLGVAWMYMRFCPVLNLAYPWQIGIAGAFVLAFIFLGSLLTERIWCRYLCPYAAFMNLFQYLGGLFHIKRRMIHRNLETCIDCCMCNRNCPMNIVVAEPEVVKDPNCIHCGICISRCPKKPTLTESGSRQFGRDS